MRETVAQPNVAPRIRRITINGYRAFAPAKPTSLEIDLGDNGNHLLLFGDNGSGKTSLFRALRDLCDTGKTERNYADEQNIFLQGEDDAIAVDLISGTPSEFRWEVGEQHPKDTEGESFHAFAKACLFLDYRDLLQTNFVHKIGSPDLFNLLVGSVLQDLPVPTRKLSEVYESLESSIPRGRQTKRPVARANGAGATLREALANHLPEVVAESNRLLEKLQKGTQIELIPPSSISYSTSSRAFSGKSILMKAVLNGEELEQPQHFLNEARLTAIALSIYLAAARIVRSGRPGIMVLDDVLIGLDLSHRLPLLKLLRDQEEFGNWQLLLFTHDRTWFDLAQLETASDGDWTQFELQSKPTQLERADGTKVFFEAPYSLPPQGTDVFQHYLAKAREAIQVPRDDRMAGLYARVAFEAKLKSFCGKKHLPVPFHPNAKDYDTDDFLSAIEIHAKARGKHVQNYAAIQRVKQFRKGVLNPLAHCHPVSLHQGEIELAIEAVGQLEFDKKVNLYDAIQAGLSVPETPERKNEAAVSLRTLFELELHDLLIRLNGRLTYRHDWNNVTLSELWDSAKLEMSSTNQASAAALIQQIESHSVIFLSEWEYPTIRSLTHQQLTDARTALIDHADATKTKLHTFH